MVFSNLFVRIWTPKLIWAFISLLIISLAGCGDAEATTEPVTLTFAYHEIDTDYYEPLVRQFNERHTDIIVELSPIAGNELNSLSANDGDIFAANALVISRLQAQGDILSLEPFLKIGGALAADDFYPGTLGVFVHEGKTWAIPSGVNVNVMYYSQDLFDQHGLSQPENGWAWDDFLDKALATRDPDGGIYGYSTTPGHFDSVLFIYQHGGRIVDDLRDPTRTTFDDPLTIEALEWYANLYHEHDVAPTPDQARRAFGNRYSYYQGVRNGKVGMWILPLSDRGGLTWQVDWNVNWQMVPLPRDERSATDAWVEGYAISTEIEQLDLGWEWILFLSQQMTYRLMPARQSLVESAIYQQQVGEGIAATAQRSMEDAVLFSPRVWTEFGAAMDIFEQAVGEIVKGDITPQEAMHRAQQEADNIIINP